MDSLAEKITAYILKTAASAPAPFAAQARRQEFHQLFLQLFQRQVEKIPLYAQYCERCGIEPAQVEHLSQIPALPQAVFKSRAWLGSEPKGEYAWTFRTSGTSALRRGERPVARMDVYADACTSGLEIFLKREFPHLAGTAQPALPQVGDGCWRIPMFFFKEPPDVARQSSLSWMLEQWRIRCGTAASAFCWAGGSRGRIFTDALRDHLREHPHRPVLVAGTALAFSSWMEQAATHCPLPEGSVVMETGGFKGRRAETAKPGLYRAISAFFSVPDSHIVNEYGMTEIFSQTYSRGSNGGHTHPPWMHIRLVNPYTSAPCIEGEPGLIEILDLANVDTVPAVQTEDIGVMRNSQLYILGRVSAELRGCSIQGDAS